MVDSLSVGQLLPVSVIAERVLGEGVTPRTALRWCIHGRAGHRLPTRRGRRRVLCTTEESFRAWLAVTSGGPVAKSTPSTLPAHEGDVLRRLGLAS